MKSMELILKSTDNSLTAQDCMDAWSTYSFEIPFGADRHDKLIDGVQAVEY